MTSPPKHYVRTLAVSGWWSYVLLTYYLVCNNTTYLQPKALRKYVSKQASHSGL